MVGGSHLVGADGRCVVCDWRRGGARAERRRASGLPVGRHPGGSGGDEGGRRRGRERVGLLDDEIHRHLALETVDVTLAEVVAQLVHLSRPAHAQLAECKRQSIGQLSLASLRGR